MQIGITGGAGFIGVALALRLQASGHTVYVMDAFTDYYDVELKLERAQRLQADGIGVFDGNVHEELGTWCESHTFDALFHLAALPGVPGSLTEPHRYIEDDIAMTVTVLEAARTHGIPHVFLLPLLPFTANRPVPYWSSKRQEM